MRPEFQPTPEQRAIVKRMSACGIRHDDIAKAIGISAPILRRAFRDELDSGMIEANAVVAESLFRMASPPRFSG